MRFKGVFFLNFRKTVPGAYILTNVATKSPVFHFAFESRWKVGIFELYGQVRNAFGGVKEIGCGQSVGWAGVCAARASATIIFDGPVWADF